MTCDLVLEHRSRLFWKRECLKAKPEGLPQYHPFGEMHGVPWPWGESHFGEGSGKGERRGGEWRAVLGLLVMAEPVEHAVPSLEA